ncbi:aromatic compound dioxygenase [Epithele typhae]|uniref:aromatic compound dioxygenase n=1 Tax=Epithele typhae TaxID=378194 RepID=UPI00200859AF|nr:aromatic compound dioxygenase [Epithele typhae]KAH9906119.1 aromatic compound dioxygenase [Epithele typhae]
MVYFASLLATTLAAVTIASAHPHPTAGTEAFEKRMEFQTKARRSLADCQATLRKRDGVYDRAIQRREAFAKGARESHKIRRDAPFLKRDLDTVLSTDHQSNLTGVTNNTDASVLFSGNSSCVLAPEVTDGPYYVTGEYVRYDVREEQEGVDIYVDVQIIDVNTCEPVPNVYLDFWHANATGVYSGISANGNGNSASEPENLNTTFLRGIQATNEDGVAQWLSIFPGHYTSRATHIHILAHENGTSFENSTYTSTYVSHVGQIFFDQDLISEVEALAPYSTNTQELTTNAEDSILSSEAADIDPWPITAAATLTEDGGVANDSSDSMGGAPSGDMPSGSMGMGMPSGSGSMGAPSDTAVDDLAVSTTSVTTTTNVATTTSTTTTSSAATITSTPGLINKIASELLSLTTAVEVNLPLASIAAAVGIHL